MVKTPHEALHRIFREDEQLLARAFETALGIRLPRPRAVSVVDPDLTEIQPLERRVDTALLIDTDQGGHVVIIESQSRSDDSRRFSWPYYVSYLHNKHQCPVILLVITADKETARWAREPMVTGLPDAPTQITQPLVLDPDNVPVIADKAAAEGDIMLAVLSALTHRLEPHAGEILETLAAALGELDIDTAVYLARFTESGLQESDAADTWRKLMTIMEYPYRSKLRQLWNDEGRAEGRAEGKAEGRAEGKAEGMVDSIITLLRARGLSIKSDLEQRLRACTDVTELNKLVVRAATVERAEDIFDA